MTAAHTKLYSVLAPKKMVATGICCVEIWGEPTVYMFRELQGDGTDPDLVLACHSSEALLVFVNTQGPWQLPTECKGQGFI